MRAMPLKIFLNVRLNFMEPFLFKPLNHMGRDMRLSKNVVYETSNGADQPAHTRNLIRAFASRLNII